MSVDFTQTARFWRWYDVSTNHACRLTVKINDQILHSHKTHEYIREVSQIGNVGVCVSVHTEIHSLWDKYSTKHQHFCLVQKWVFLSVSKSTSWHCWIGVLLVLSFDKRRKSCLYCAPQGEIIRLFTPTSTFPICKTSQLGIASLPVWGSHQICGQRASHGSPRVKV